MLQLGYCDSNCICTKFQLDLPIFYVYTTSTPSNTVLLTYSTVTKHRANIDDISVQWALLVLWLYNMLAFCAGDPGSLAGSSASPSTDSKS